MWKGPAVPSLCGIAEVPLYGSTSLAAFTITRVIVGMRARNAALTLAKGKQLTLGIAQVWMARNGLCVAAKSGVFIL
jgi:hypothetical protein